MNFDYEEIFKITNCAMRLNKSHPAQKRDITWITFFFFCHGLACQTFFLILYNIICFNIKSKDFDETCKNGVLAMVFIVVTLQYFIMLWKQDLIMNLITLVKQDYERAKFLTIDEQEIMMDYAKKGVYVCKQWLIIACTAFGVFPFTNIVSMIYHLVMGEPKLIQLYEFVYPGLIHEYKDNIFMYFGIYSVLFFHGVYSVCMYAAFVALGPSFILHACGQLEIVEKKFERLFENDVDEAKEKLKEVVKQLQSIYSFVDQIQESFRVAYEMTLKATTIILPVACYEVLEAFRKGQVSLEFITFIIGSILFSSTPCYYGDLLMDKGEKVRLSIYFCGWESVYDRGIRSTILILLIHALRPVAIRTLYRTMCLETLTELFHQAYTIFNLMNAMWK